MQKFWNLCNIHSNTLRGQELVKKNRNILQDFYNHEKVTHPRTHRERLWSMCSLIWATGGEVLAGLEWLGRCPVCSYIWFWCSPFTLYTTKRTNNVWSLCVYERLTSLEKTFLNLPGSRSFSAFVTASSRAVTRWVTTLTKAWNMAKYTPILSLGVSTYCNLVHTGIEVLELLCVAVEVVHLLCIAGHVVLHVLQLAFELLYTEHDTLYAVVQQLFLQ